MAAPGYGRVRLRKQGQYYHVRYRGRDGKRVNESLKVTNLQIAERMAREINDLLEAGQFSKLESRKTHRNITFQEVVEEFLSTYDGWSDSTKISTRSIIVQLCQEFGDIPIRDIDAKAMDGYLARRRDEGLAESSCTRYLAILKVIFKKAEEWDYVTVNVASSMKLRPLPEKKPNPYRNDELEPLFFTLVRRQASFPASDNHFSRSTPLVFVPLR